MSCGVGRRHCSDPAFLWLWRRLAVTTLTGPLAWEPPYAAGVAQEIAKRQKNKTKQNETKQKKTKKLKRKHNIFIGTQDLLRYSACI